MENRHGRLTSSSHGGRHERSLPTGPDTGALSLSDYELELVRREGTFVIYRGHRTAVGTSGPASVLVRESLSANHQQGFEGLEYLERCLLLRTDLRPEWATRPIGICERAGRTALVLEDPGGEPLDLLIAARKDGRRGDLESFLRLAVGVAGALAEVHARGLVHGDLRPANVLADPRTGRAWITGFGVASRSSFAEADTTERGWFAAEGLPYMAPERTGCVNRSIDARSDLYSLGVTLYELLTGCHPFVAATPLEWVHCHLARRPTPVPDRTDASGDVPEVLAKVVMRLLAKNADDRYQTAAGIESDLRRCLAQYQDSGRIDEFEVGEHDVPDRPTASGKIFGRERVLDLLRTSFEEVAETGEPALALLAGRSGVGKSSIAQEIERVLAPKDVLFAAGEFEANAANVPYGGLGQALRSLARGILTEDDANVRDWRGRLREALGTNAALLAKVIPELKLLLGEPAPVLALPESEAQRRLLLAVRRFLACFTSASRPLVLFLDDLQWAEAPALDALDRLLTQSEAGHLFVIGTYRDEDVDSSHLLTKKLQGIRRASTRVLEVTVGPLGQESLRQLVADRLRCKLSRASELGRIVHEKTGGNPLFAIQLIDELARTGAIAYSRSDGGWIWDIDRVRAEPQAPVVADATAGRLASLPTATLNVLEYLACLRNAAGLRTLSIVLAEPEATIEAALLAAIQQEILEEQDGAYRFVHDRFREAAYSLIPAESRGETHLRIGRRLAEHGDVPQESALFERANQLNRATALLVAPGEREDLAELDLEAGRRAKAAGAHAHALEYLAAGMASLPDDAWDRRRDLAFALTLERAECELSTGAAASAEHRLQQLAGLAAGPAERSSVTCLRLDACLMLGQSDRGAVIGVEYARRSGLDWPAHPTDDDVRAAYERVVEELGNRTREELADLPIMTDPDSMAIMDVLSKFGPSAISSQSNHPPATGSLGPSPSSPNANLFALAACAAVSLSLVRGNTDSSSEAYVKFGLVALQRFDNDELGLRLGQVGCDLVERRGFKRFGARALILFGGCLMPFAKHVRAGRPMLRRAFELAMEVGDVVVAAHYRVLLDAILLAAGDPLEELEREAEQGLAFAEKAGVRGAADTGASQLAFIRTLRGSTHAFGSLDSDQFDERDIESQFAKDPNRALAESRYGIRKMQARYLAGDYAGARLACSTAQRLAAATEFMPAAAEYHLFRALIAGAGDEVTAENRRIVAEDHARFQRWARHCPDNFETGAALLGAELARLEGRDSEAMRLYERALRSATAAGFVHQEALASELAARFYFARGAEKAGKVHLRQALEAYRRWGATGKVHQLEQLYAHELQDDIGGIGDSPTFTASVDQMDLATVLKVSQAVADEIVPDRLLETVLQTAVEHAGADRGALLVQRAGEMRVEVEAEAEARSDGGSLVVRRLEAPGDALVPASVIDYVAQTLQRVLIGDVAKRQHSFVGDGYFDETKARSLLCLPLLRKGNLIAVLYLENTLAPNTFSPARLRVLSVLASQAALSLEQERLSRELALRDSKARALFEANPVGVIIADANNKILEANEAFLNMIGYSRAELRAGQVRWTDLAQPDWLAGAKGAAAASAAPTMTPAFQSEYLRRDGSRIPVLVGGIRIEGESNGTWVAFALDLSDRRRAEQEGERARRLESEQQAALASERTRLARDVHDTLAQQLAMMVTQLAHVETQLGPAWALAERPLRTVRDLAIEGLAHARRSVDVLRPPSVSPGGLARALREIVESARRHFTGPVTLAVSGPAVLLEADVEGALVGIAREALNNAIRHSDAPQIAVSLEFDGAGGARIVVCDDGIGFDLGCVRKDGYGLTAIRERADQAGILLTFVTERGAGTQVVASWSPATSSSAA